jgi:two-component system, cell cycle sensor histidine kinase and response regulator CckA
MPVGRRPAQVLPFDYWADLAQGALGVAGAVVAVTEGRRQVVRGLGGRFTTWWPGPELLADHGLCARVADLGRPLLNGGRETGAGAELQRPGAEYLVSFAGVPIRSPEGEVLGTLCVVEEEPREWSGSDVALLEGFARAVAAELQVGREQEARRRAEAAMHRAEAKFRTIFDSTALGIALIGQDGWLIRSNSALQRMLRSDEEELRGRRFVDYLHPDEVEEAGRVFEQIARGSSESHQLEQRFVLADGGDMWGHVIASSVRDRHDRPLCGLALVEDVTQRKSAEAALQESQRQLLLSQRMEAVGRLAGGIAHDFNNLLTAIGSFAQLLQLEMEPRSDTDLYVGEIQKAASRAGALTRQLLAFSRQQVLRAQRLDLNHVVAEVESMLRRVIGENIELVTRLDPAIPPVMADPGQVEQVLMNLVVNARDAMPFGGRVVIQTLASEITEEEAGTYAYEVTPGSYVRVVVSDSGEGMGDETLARIFEPFFTTKEPGKGTGLGLSTAYGIVKQSGGYIWASSEIGVGTTFDIYLPRAEGEAAPAEREGREQRVRGGSETVLLVEDEKTIRTLAERILMRHGYTVLAAANGVEALRIAEAHGSRIDLLLTDVIMPGMNGRTLAQRLQARRPELPVLFMSGYTADAIRQYGVFDPDAFFLDKPFTPDLLADAVRNALDRSGE